MSSKWEDEWLIFNFPAQIPNFDLHGNFPTTVPEMVAALSRLECCLARASNCSWIFGFQEKFGFFDNLEIPQHCKQEEIACRMRAFFHSLLILHTILVPLHRFQFSWFPHLQHDFLLLLWYNRFPQFPRPPIGEINEILCSFNNCCSGNLKIEIFHQKKTFLANLQQSSPFTESLSFDFRVVEAAD